MDFLHTEVAVAAAAQMGHLLLYLHLIEVLGVKVAAETVARLLQFKKVLLLVL
jgi:hypothetical protein